MEAVIFVVEEEEEEEEEEEVVVATVMETKVKTMTLGADSTKCCGRRP